MRKNQDGFAVIYVVFAAAALFVLVSMAMKLMYSFRKQDRQLRNELVERARDLNMKYSSSSQNK